MKSRFYSQLWPSTNPSKAGTGKEPGWFNAGSFSKPLSRSARSFSGLMPYISAVCLMSLLAAPQGHASIKANTLFSSGAVLQQGIDIPIWGTADEGEKVTVDLNDQTATTMAKQGKWKVSLKPQRAGGPYTLKISGEKNVISNEIMIGEVWLCSGQSNMEFPMRVFPKLQEEIARASNPNLRFYSVSANPSVLPLSEAIGNWTACTPEVAANFSATAYFFGRDLQKALGVTVGLLKSAWGGSPAQAWTSLEGLEAEPELAAYVNAIEQRIAAYPQNRVRYEEELMLFEKEIKLWNETPEGAAFKMAQRLWIAEHKKCLAAGLPPPPAPTEPQEMPKAPKPPYGSRGSPTVLYNGMIAPLIPYGLRGVIWYQGESNNLNPSEYQVLFPRLIQDWRQKWGLGEFPFLFVQVAPFKELTPELREAQLLSWKKTRHTAMVVTADIGNAEDIHPQEKEQVGARLALAARSIAYGEKIVYSGPVYQSQRIEDNQVILSFEHANSGLIAKGGPLRGFTIAGAAGEFRPAKAEIEGNTVVVSSSEVSKPTAVRYGWANVPDVNLFNTEGLPASPFRTER